MGTGTVGLIGYGLCCFVAAAIIATGCGLIWWGQKAERKRRSVPPENDEE